MQAVSPLLRMTKKKKKMKKKKEFEAEERRFWSLREALGVRKTGSVPAFF